MGRDPVTEFGAPPDGHRWGGEWQNFGWQAGNHRLVIAAGSYLHPGSAQLAYWQPGDTHLRIATIRNPAEITDLQNGNIG